MPAVDRFHPALLTDQALDVAVVIDVLRATSTAIILLARGAAAVRVVATPEGLGRLPPASGDYLVFSELEASRAWGLECVDNSPALAEALPIAGRLPVLVTTNGTRAIASAIARARRVLVAGFVNLSSTVRHLGDAERVTLLPAGDFAGREGRTEDDRCADALQHALLGRGRPDLERLVADCWADARVQRRIARHPELKRDVEIALHVDRCDAVAVVADGNDAGVCLVRAG